MRDQASIMERLRTETHDVHTRVEALPFFTALRAGELPLAAYVGFLRALCTVYEIFEQELSADPLLKAVWGQSLPKLPLLQRDLAFFEGRDLPMAPVATLRAALLGQQLRNRAQAAPDSLLGYLHVLEGPTLGGLVPRAQVASRFRLSRAGGLAYLASYETATKARWLACERRMSRALADPAVQQRSIEAACEALAGIGQIAEALHPLDAQPRDLVRALNPEAGTHAIPSDPRELQAALRAGERSWRQFPYYEWRYGKRGEQFTRSDSAWLVTLSEYSPAVVEQQILWLGRVLASRGMPQWMLELHLEVLHEELVAMVPEKQATYASLRQVADTLGELRRSHIDDTLFHTLITTFDQAVGDEWSARLPQTGGLLAAAVADERCGIAQAVSSIEGWMSDPARFPPAWVAAVRATISTARTQAT